MANSSLLPRLLRLLLVLMWVSSFSTFGAPLFPFVDLSLFEGVLIRCHSVSRRSSRPLGIRVRRGKWYLLFLNRLIYHRQIHVEEALGIHRLILMAMTDWRFLDWCLGRRSDLMRSWDRVRQLITCLYGSPLNRSACRTGVHLWACFRRSWVFRQSGSVFTWVR